MTAIATATSRQRRFRELGHHSVDADEERNMRLVVHAYEALQGSDRDRLDFPGQREAV